MRTELRLIDFVDERLFTENPYWIAASILRNLESVNMV